MTDRARPLWAKSLTYACAPAGLANLYSINCVYPPKFNGYTQPVAYIGMLVETLKDKHYNIKLSKCLQKKKKPK